MNKIMSEVEWRRCAADPFHAARYFKIKHPERGSIPLEMREAQIETLDLWLNERMTITLKARQIGFSTLAAFTMWWVTYFHNDRPVYALSKTEREAQKLLDKVKYGMDRLPDWMKERGPNVLQKTLQKVTFDNDSTIECLPATDPARGESAYMIFVDEWAHFEDAERAWAAIEPAADIGGRVHALSSANGSGNLFHTMYVAAETGTSEFKNIFFPWNAVPERNAAWYATKKRSMLEWQLHQEYPSTPNEAFIKSGNPVFDIDVLMAMETDDPNHRGYLHPTGPRSSELHFDSDGPLQVWELPRTMGKYVVGADVAEGLEHGDYSVAHVIDIESGKVVAKWRGHIDPDLFGSHVLWYLGWFYNYALMGPEVNNHGLTTVSALSNKGYGNMYYRSTYDERTMKKGKKLGWLTTAKSKPLMVDELVRAMRPEASEDGGYIPFTAELDLRDSETVGELMTFRRDIDGKMRGSPYDDQTMSLAIANQMRKHSFTVDPSEDSGPKPYTLDWYVAGMDAEGYNDGEWVIGSESTVPVGQWG